MNTNTNANTDTNTQMQLGQGEQGWAEVEDRTGEWVASNQSNLSERLPHTSHTFRWHFFLSVKRKILMKYLQVAFFLEYKRTNTDTH